MFRASLETTQTPITLLNAYSLIKANNEPKYNDSEKNLTMMRDQGISSEMSNSVVNLHGDHSE
jgi:hypothetical protein